MTASEPPTDAPKDRLALLEELVEALRPQVLATHTEHGLQGVSGIVGQYLKAIEQVELLKAAREEPKGTTLDELAKRRAGRGADSARPTRSASNK